MRLLGDVSCWRKGLCLLSLVFFFSHFYVRFSGPLRRRNIGGKGSEEGGTKVSIPRSCSLAWPTLLVLGEQGDC